MLQAKIANRPNHSEMFKLLSKEIELGRFYPTNKLQEICERHGLKHIKELREWELAERKIQDDSYYCATNVGCFLDANHYMHTADFRSKWKPRSV